MTSIYWSCYLSLNFCDRWETVNWTILNHMTIQIWKNDCFKFQIRTVWFEILNRPYYKKNFENRNLKSTHTTNFLHNQLQKSISISGFAKKALHCIRQLNDDVHIWTLHSNYNNASLVFHEMESRCFFARICINCHWNWFVCRVLKIYRLCAFRMMVQMKRSRSFQTWCVCVFFSPYESYLWC